VSVIKEQQHVWMGGITRKHQAAHICWNVDCRQVFSGGDLSRAFAFGQGVTSAGHTHTANVVFDRGLIQFCAVLAAANASISPVALKTAIAMQGTYKQPMTNTMTKQEELDVKAAREAVNVEKRCRTHFKQVVLDDGMTCPCCAGRYGCPTGGSDGCFSLPISAGNKDMSTGAL
jgi:hypothetical protein